MATFGYFLYLEMLKDFKRCEDLKVCEKLDCYLSFHQCVHLLIVSFIGLFSCSACISFAFPPHILHNKKLFLKLVGNSLHKQEEYDILHCYV